MKQKSLFGIAVTVACLMSCTHKLPVEDSGNWVPLGKDEQIDLYCRHGDSIYAWWGLPEDDYVDFSAMKGVDVETFEVCKTSYEAYYAKDKFHVYYPIWIISYDGMECGGMYATEYIVKRADPKTFKYIGNGYGADKRHMYYRGKRIKWDNEVIRSKGLRTSADILNLVDTEEIPVEGMNK